MATTHMDQALADQMVEKAIAFCAHEKYCNDIAQTRQALIQGRCDDCYEVKDQLIREVGEYLGQMDQTVRAVFSYEPATSTSRRIENPPIIPMRENIKQSQSDRFSPRGGINLIAWVDRKSAALSVLGVTLENALAISRQKIGCRNARPACFILDIKMVDDKDISERRGYGVVVNNLYIHSTQVWSRPVAKDLSASPTLIADFPPGLNTTQYDPELTPESTLIDQALAIEKLPTSERIAHEHQMEEIKVLLIRRMISDQLAYINIAKEWFTTEDLIDIFQRKIGYGKIGGKTAGMLLAARIINQVAEPEIRQCIHIPESFFIGSDGVYLFMAMNGLMHWNDQKYKPEEQIRSEYPQIKHEFEAGEFPPEIMLELQGVLDKVGRQPIIVRSSSQLEDSFGTAFAGKYDSHFCPNQGSPEENLVNLTKAIARTYASTLKPEALLYRRSKGLQDYDERMAILIQVVQGEQFGRYFLPHGAGVAFSRNIYRWSPEIRREDGYARLVWGLGTRAVERVGNDYPRLVALSHPTLQPDDSCEAIRHYSQQYVDVIDLQENIFKTLPAHEVLKPNYPPLRFLAQIEQDGYFTTPRSRVMEAEVPRLAITFDELLRRTPFAAQLSRLLHILEEHYHDAVDMEFTLQILDLRAIQSRVKISLLQCRSQSYLRGTRTAQVPKDLPADQVIFSSRFVVPSGYVSDIHYVLFIPPETYFNLPTNQERRQLAGIIGLVNAALAEQSFICVGPGRWGSVNTDLGVYVSYAEICHAEALVELAGEGIGPAPEPSLGTHFFQDLMEAQIYPLAICFDSAEVIFNRNFFYDTPNRLLEIISCEAEFEQSVRLIQVADYQPGLHIDLVMDDEQSLAVAYLSSD